MRIATLCRHIVVLVVLVWCSPQMYAHQDGITGLYQAGCGSRLCHGGEANQATQLTLTGGTTLKVGDEAAFTFKVANNDQKAGGLDLAILNAAGEKQQGITAGDGSQVLDNELTHTKPKAFVKGSTSFEFTWKAPAAHGVYTLYASGNAVNASATPAGDIWNSMSKQITVAGATLTGPLPAQAYCVGEAIAITWTATGIDNVRIEISNDDFTTFVVVMKSIAASKGTYSYTLPDKLPTSGNYAIRLVNTADDKELSRTLYFSVNGIPVVQTEPISQSICLGRTFRLVAGASGKEPKYQWRHNGDDIPGGTDPILHIASISDEDAGAYDCVITSCDHQVTTKTADIVVQHKPNITKQTSGPQAICEGVPLTMSVDATGDNLTYEWYKNGAVVAGMMQSSYEIKGAGLGDEGTYFCVVSGDCTPPDTSSTVAVDVLEKPAITGQPTGATLKAGEKLTLAVGASGDSLHYQWYHKGTLIVGATGNTLVINAVVRADSGDYYCWVKNICDSAQSRKATVIVNPGTGPGVLSISVNLLDLNVIGQCQGADTTLTALVSNTGGTDITITSISSDQPSLVQVKGLTAPVELPPGGSKDVEIIVTPQDANPILASVAFFSTGGKVVLTVMSKVKSDLHFENDTLVFADGLAGYVNCTVSLPIPCMSASIVSAKIAGSGASTYGFNPPLDLPLDISSGKTIEVCIQTQEASGSDARVEFGSTAGTATLYLVRKKASSVNESEAGIAGMVLVPNPMDDHLSISFPTDAFTRIQVYSVLGTRLQTLEGRSSIQWDGTDAGGNRLRSGLYILTVEQGHHTDMRRVLIRR